MKNNLVYLLGLLFLVSCGPTRNLAYFSDLQEQAVYTEQIATTTTQKIQPDDLLSITVTSLNAEANALFNKGVAPAAGKTAGFGAATNLTDIHDEGYLVDAAGNIEFPVLGKIKLAGLTKQEAKEKLAEQLNQYLKDPIINIRYLNFRVTVVGEVNRPSTFTIPSEKINVLQALGLAGDMTAFGKRENVLIIRETGGERQMARIDLNNKEVLNSPYFYLQQNDVVYVEPDKMKQVQASTNTRTLSIIASVTSLAIVVASRLF